MDRSILDINKLLVFTTMDSTIHHGRNIKRFREMMGIKQEALADALGSDWSQKKVSLLEQKDKVEEELMSQVAEVLKVPVEAIKKFDEEFAVNIISNTFTSHDHATGLIYNQNPTFNPLDKLLEVMEENKKLYERLLESEREKVELLKKMLDK
jgi:transcriptional regulator with XRE-family HTH domain